jgi:hypothetical protein
MSSGIKAQHSHFTRRSTGRTSGGPGDLETGAGIHGTDGDSVLSSSNQRHALDSHVPRTSTGQRLGARVKANLKASSLRWHSHRMIWYVVGSLHMSREDRQPEQSSLVAYLDALLRLSFANGQQCYAAIVGA